MSTKISHFNLPFLDLILTTFWASWTILGDIFGAVLHCLFYSCGCDGCDSKMASIDLLFLLWALRPHYVFENAPVMLKIKYLV